MIKIPNQKMTNYFKFQIKLIKARTLLYPRFFGYRKIVKTCTMCLFLHFTLLFFTWNSQKSSTSCYKQTSTTVSNEEFAFRELKLTNVRRGIGMQLALSLRHKRHFFSQFKPSSRCFTLILIELQTNHFYLHVTFENTFYLKSTLDESLTS